MTDSHINIFWSEQDGGYIADIPDLRACSAFGATPAEALAELQRAKAAWLETGGRGQHGLPRAGRSSKRSSAPSLLR
jgi:predicted RNase H-like HicB family nuclease